MGFLQWKRHITMIVPLVTPLQQIVEVLPGSILGSVLSAVFLMGGICLPNGIVAEPLSALVRLSCLSDFAAEWLSETAVGLGAYPGSRCLRQLCILPPEKSWIHPDPSRAWHVGPKRRDHILTLH